MRNVVVLLSGNKRSHHSLQNIKNSASIEPLPQQPGKMNHPRDVCISKPQPGINFLTFIKQSQFIMRQQSFFLLYSCLLMDNLAFAVALPEVPSGSAAIY